MVEAYQQAKDKFLKELRFIFPHSSNLIVEINVDNIATKDFDTIPLPHKEESILDGALRWKGASIGSDEITDIFTSEYL